MIYSISVIYKKIFTPFRKKTMKTRIIKNIFNKKERRCRDVKKHANKVGKPTQDPKPLPYNPT